jgi:hypothetical protein
MILEEVPETNPLVPGSPDNPIKLGEKAKNILIRLKMAEDADTPGELGRVCYDEVDRSNALDRLMFLKLIETITVQPTQERLLTAVLKKQAMLDMIAANGKAQDISYAAQYWASAESDCRPLTRWGLTYAGRALLISGSVTVSL